MIFGHRDASNEVLTNLKDSIEFPFNKCGVTEFYVGNNGSFDSMALTALRDAKERYPNYYYGLLLGYRSSGRGSFLKKIPSIQGDRGRTKAFFILWRKDRMIELSNYVICSAGHIAGGASKFVENAAKKGKTIINLSQSILLCDFRNLQNFLEIIPKMTNSVNHLRATLYIMLYLDHFCLCKITEYLIIS